MEISTIKVFSQGISSKENTETKLKGDYNNHLERLKKYTLSQDSVKVTINDKPDTVIYNKNGYINNKSEITHSNGTSGWDITKEVGTSLIPIYGTYKEFEKGNIGWGIFGIFTDILSLVPVIGSGAKALGTAIRGGSTAVRAAKFGLTTAKFVSKATTTTVAKQFAVGATEGLAKSGKELGKTVLRAADPGIELLYKGGETITYGTTKLVTAPAKSAIAVKTAIGAKVTKNISESKNMLETTKGIDKFTKNIKINTLYEKKPDVNDILNYAHDFIKKTDYSWHIANKENPKKLFDQVARREFNRKFLLKDIGKFSLKEKKQMLVNMESNFGTRLRGVTDFVAEKIGYNSENMKLISTASKYTPVMEDITSVLKNQVGEIPSKIRSPLYIENLHDLKKIEINALSNIGIKINDLK